MSKITIYTKRGCPYCENAKTLFKKLRLQYHEIELRTDDPSYEIKKHKLFSYFKHYSYPIILIGDKFIGGYSDLINEYNTLKLHKRCSDIGLYVPFDR